MEDKSDPAGLSRTLETVTRTLEIISLLESDNGARVTEIADKLCVSKSSVYNHLTTLRQNDYVSKSGDQYNLSYRFLTLGEFVRNQDRLYQHGRAEVEQLAETTGEYAHLTVEQNGLGVNLYKVRGEDAVGANFQTARLQKPDFLHYSATGKSILAHLSEDRVRSIVDTHGLPKRTEQTITDINQLLAELDEVRDQGFAHNEEEEVRGIRAVGVPILDQREEVLGAMSVSGSKSRLRGDRFRKDLPDLLTRAANVIEVDINTATRSNNFPSF